MSTPGTLIFVAMLSMTVAAQGIRPQDVAFERAVRTETVDGDVRGAIRQYSELVNGYATSDPGVAAQSLVRMGFLYKGLGDVGAARETFERVLREYPNQTQPAAQAQRALGGSARRMTQERVSAGIGDKGAAAVSPDGRWIAFGSEESFVIRRNGSTQNHVSVPGADPPLFSPDSKRVAYNHWGVSTTGRRPAEFRLASLDGRWSPRNVKTSPPDVRYYQAGGWSADGQSVLVEIVHQDWTKEIAWLSLATGETRVLTNLGHRRPQDPLEGVSLSPDGRWIVYSAFPVDPGPNAERVAQERERHLYLLPAKGGTPTELVGGSINVRPLWTPDSRRVVFVSNRSGSFGVWSVTAGERRESPVVEMASSGRVALIGLTKSGALYFARNETGNDLFVTEVRPDGRVGAPVLLPTGEAGSNIEPAWSPDRRFIAYLRGRKDRPSGTYSLVVHSMADHTERVFDSRDLGYSRPKWFPDGTRVLVSISPGRLFVVDIVSGTFTLARDVLGFPASRSQGVSLSPDGKTAYMAQPVAQGVDRGGALSISVNAGPFTVIAVDLAAGTRRIVLAENPDLRRSDLVPSPDGRSLAFITAKTGENIGTLWLVGSDGQGLRELSTSAGIRVLAWAADGRAIYFLEPRGDISHLMRVPINGGTPQDAGLTETYDWLRGGTLAGNQFAFAQRSAVRELWVVKDFAAR